MKNVYSLLAFCVVGIVALTSCSTFSLVNSETYNNADLASIKTFRIVSPADGKLPPGMEMVTYYNITAAIREQLVERGWTESPNSPILVNIGLTVHKEIQTAPALTPPAPVPGPGGPPPAGPFYNGMYPYFMYPRALYWQYGNPNAQVITGIYKEGVLTMDIVNIYQKLPLYSASVSTILQNGDSQFRNLEGIAEAVKTLFSKFPVPIVNN